MTHGIYGVSIWFLDVDAVVAALLSGLVASVIGALSGAWVAKRNRDAEHEESVSRMLAENTSAHQVTDNKLNNLTTMVAKLERHAEDTRGVLGHVQGALGHVQGWITSHDRWHDRLEGGPGPRDGGHQGG